MLAESWLVQLRVLRALTRARKRRLVRSSSQAFSFKGVEDTPALRPRKENRLLLQAVGNQLTG
jgi:hypothetical protein